MEYKIAVITFKTIHGMATKYLHDLIDIRQSHHYNLRSNKGIVLCDESGMFKRTLGDRSFRAAALKIWNKLPDDIKVSQKLDTFKRKLKTHYFKLAFSILHQFNSAYNSLIVMLGFLNLDSLETLLLDCFKMYH